MWWKKKQKEIQEEKPKVTYDDIRNKIQFLKEKLKNKENEFAAKGTSFDEMIIETTPLRWEIFQLDKDLRLLQSPTVEYNKEWKGITYTLDDFKNLSENGNLNDDDGIGYYGTENCKSDIKIFPSDIKANKIRTDFTHVIWLEKIKEDF